MTHFKIYSLLIVLIIAAHGILVIQGRLLKSVKKQELYDNKKSNALNADNLQNLPADGVPSAGLPIADKRSTFPTPVASQSQGYGSSVPESVNDFRPTTPGNSPGAGHSFTEHRFNTQSAFPQSSVPTGPGHSPGGGHSKQDQITKPNA